MGLGPWAMGVFVVLLALILIGVFAGVWLHDRRRSDGVSDDRSRHHTDRSQ
jgi:hypothetical protein